MTETQRAAMVNAQVALAKAGRWAEVNALRAALAEPVRPFDIDQIAADRYKVVEAHESMFHRWAVVAGDGKQQLYIGREVECQNMARKFAGAFLDGAWLASQHANPQAQQPAEPVGEPVAQLGVGNSGFDHKTAADFLSGKNVSDENVRRFVAQSRWAHDGSASLRALTANLRQDLALRDAEIALLKQSLLDAEAQQPADPVRKPVAYVHCPSSAMNGEVRPVLSFEKYESDYASGIYTARIPLYTAPQPQQPAEVPLLTDDDAYAIYEQVMGDCFTDAKHHWSAGRASVFARAIEQAVRQKAGLK